MASRENAGGAAINLSGLSLQYASATGTGSFAAHAVVALSNVAVQPGQYILVSLAAVRTKADRASTTLLPYAA